MKTSKQEKINEINSKYDQNYILNESGRIYTTFMNKKMWFKFDELVQRWENFDRERNADKNAKVVCEFITKKGGDLTYTSIHGSFYFNFKGFKIRVSNHDWTSEYHLSPDVNLCSYSENGHEEMISKFQKIVA